MRDFGLGKQSLEERIQEEAIALAEYFSSKRGQPFDPHQVVHKVISNIICSVVFGKRYFLLPANEVCEGYVFTRVCLSTGGGRIPACLAG